MRCSENVAFDAAQAISRYYVIKRAELYQKTSFQNIPDKNAGI